jgi:mannose-6-phosphate isomerase-like protein (cupin superfamily)
MSRSATLAITAAALAIGLLAQSASHMRVPPSRVPSVYMSAADIQTALDKIDPKLIASPTGGAVNIGKGLNVVVRRRITGPQYAITHTRDMEYLVIMKGTATLVTGGTLIPPTIDSDPYPSTNPDAIIRSSGDVVVSPPGTPHWLSKIDGAIEYAEIRIPNVDPAPGIERAEVLPK